MKIKEILDKYRRDLVAVYECEHCGHIITAGGYDDKNFHTKVIPAMICEKCGKTSADDYVPLQPEYPEDFQI
ncbi:MAG: hypothetical protein JHC33_01230 [Ignisphaera sp.]|nr:hypothetical protein [Ignisphaera sp.]